MTPKPKQKNREEKGLFKEDCPRHRGIMTNYSQECICSQNSTNKSMEERFDKELKKEFPALYDLLCRVDIRGIKISVVFRKWVKSFITSEIHQAQVEGYEKAYKDLEGMSGEPLDDRFARLSENLETLKKSIKKGL